MTDFFMPYSSFFILTLSDLKMRFYYLCLLQLFIFIAFIICLLDVDKLSKMKKLLEILSNPNKRMPLDTLLKCEVVLEKLDFKRGDGSVGPPVTTLKEHQIFSPLLEAVSGHLQSPVINHTLQRTFGPCQDALFGPEIK